MIRVLQCVNNMHRAGLETMLMNYYRNIDRTKIQFDFLTHRPERYDYDDEIESLGGKIYHAPRLFPQNYPAYFSYMKRFFQEHPEYKIVHSHIDAMSYLPLMAAKKAGVPVRIAHSHNTAIDFDFKYPLKWYFKNRIASVATHRYACGEAAGRFLFEEQSFKVIPNAIDAEQFRFDPVIREKKRLELGLADKFVVGHVGRFSRQKNHRFLMEIFCQIRKRKDNAILLLVGTGELLSQIKKQAETLGIENYVLFLGSRSDVHELYQAMDVFVMPSLFEGVPVVGIEAQFSGLPCVYSDKVPGEVIFTGNCCLEKLTASAVQWAERVFECEQKSSGMTNVIHSRYDIQQAKKVLEKQYLELYQQI